MFKTALVVLHSQPGATMENFNKLKCEKELIKPIMHVRKYDESLGVVVVILAKKQKDILPRNSAIFGFGEIAYEDPRKEEGLPHHLTSPTARHIRDVFSYHEVEVLVYDHWKNLKDWDTLLGLGVGFAQNQGAKEIIQVPYGEGIPSPCEIEMKLKQLRVPRTVAV